MKLRGLTVLILMLFSVAAFAADASGTWKGQINAQPGHDAEVVLKVKAQGDKLTGTLEQGGGGEKQITDGQVKGDQISFVIPPIGADGRKVNFTGKIEGDQLKLARHVEGVDRVHEITLTRSK